MKNFVLTILERETVYGSRLAGYIGGHPGSPFQVKLFLEHPAPDEDVAACDIAVMTSSLREMYGGLFSGRPVLILDEDGSASEEVDLWLYKYQSAEAVYKKLLDICIESGNKRIRPGTGSSKDFKIRILYLPLPVKDTVRRFREWIRRESGMHRLLYVNMEPVPCPLVSLPGQKPGEKGFSDIIYYLKQQGANLGARISSMAVCQDYDSISPPDLAADADHLSQGDWTRLSLVLREETEYEQLLLDYGPGLPPAAVLGCCDEILVCTAGSRWEEEYISRYREILERMGRPGLDEILHRLDV